MVKGICPECDELWEVTPDKIQNSQRGTSRWWKLTVHPDRRTDPPTVCTGSGKLI